MLLKKIPMITKSLNVQRLAALLIFITGDKKHLLPMKKYQQILIVNAINFLQINCPDFV
jgi:hypothetical protein